MVTVHTPATTGDEPDTKKQKMEEQPTLPTTADTTTHQDTKEDLMPSLPSLPTDDTSPPAAANTTPNASTATTLPLTEEEKTQRIKPSELGSLWKCAGCGLNENECNTPLLLFEDPEEVDPTSKEGEDGKKCEEEKR